MRFVIIFLVFVVLLSMIMIFLSQKCFCNRENLNTDLPVDKKLTSIHNKLKLDFGTFQDEYPEQEMAALFLKGDEKVLEIGGNIGRNTLIIASILKNDKNLVSMECDPEIAKQLEHNKEINNMNFYVENTALSKRNLIQKGWDTIVSDIVLPEYKKVNTITYEQLNKKYNIQFDTLVLDCEGAFYYILQDMPEILNNIKLIIMENDYHDITHKNYVDDVLTKKGFKNIYTKAGGWGPCYDRFFEVWGKSN